MIRIEYKLLARLPWRVWIAGELSFACATFLDLEKLLS